MNNDDLQRLANQVEQQPRVPGPWRCMPTPWLSESKRPGELTPSEGVELAQQVVEIARARPSEHWITLTRKDYLRRVEAFKQATEPQLFFEEVSGLSEPPMERIGLLDEDGQARDARFRVIREWRSEDGTVIDNDKPGRFWVHQVRVLEGNSKTSSA